MRAVQKVVYTWLEKNLTSRYLARACWAHDENSDIWHRSVKNGDLQSNLEVVIVLTRYLNVYLSKQVYNKAINSRRDFSDNFC